MKTYMKGYLMKQISISEIQRNLHKLDSFDIVEVIDKKRDKVKGYFLDSKYVTFIHELIEKQIESSQDHELLGGSLHKYANPDLINKEEDAWKQHLKVKHTV